jgi:hypothetical protein
MLNHLAILKRQGNCNKLYCYLIAYAVILDAAEGYRRNLAHRIICEDCKCSDGDCLMKLEYRNALKIVEACLEEVQHLTRSQKKQYMLEKVRI